MKNKIAIKLLEVLELKDKLLKTKWSNAIDLNSRIMNKVTEVADRFVIACENSEKDFEKLEKTATELGRKLEEEFNKLTLEQIKIMEEEMPKKSNSKLVNEVNGLIGFVKTGSRFAKGSAKILDSSKEDFNNLQVEVKHLLSKIETEFICATPKPEATEPEATPEPVAETETVQAKIYRIFKGSGQ
jgi:hypothetical protein